MKQLREETKPQNDRIEQFEEEISIDSYFEFFRQRAWIIILLVVTVPVLTYFLHPRLLVYRAESTIRLGTVTEKEYETPADLHNAIVRDRILNRIKQEYDLSYSTGDLRKKISTTRIVDTSKIIVSAEDADPGRARDISAGVAQRFVAYENRAQLTDDEFRLAKKRIQLVRRELKLIDGFLKGTSSSFFQADLARGAQRDENSSGPDLITFKTTLDLIDMEQNLLIEEDELVSEIKEMSNKVVIPAAQPSSPQGTNRRQNVLISAAAALLLGIGLVAALKGAHDKSSS